MFKKLLAGLTTIVLSLGLVAITAAPASAHHNTITAQVSCNTTTEGYWKVVWTVKNSESRSETITASNDESIIPVGTVIGSNGTYTKTLYYSAKPGSNKTLVVSAEWTNGGTNTSDGTLYKNDFKDNCLPDDTSKKVTICHWDNGHGGEWGKQTVSISSIINNGGHDSHSKDIIPPFEYVKQGVPGSYGGKNWEGNAYNQWLHGQGCDNKVTPAKPSSSNAVCAAPGQSLGKVTIPGNVVGFTYSYRYGTGGSWNPVGSEGLVLSVSQGTTVQVRVDLVSGYSATWGSGWTGGSGSYRYLQFTIGGTQSSKCVEAAVPSFQPEVCNDPGTGSTAGYYVVTGTSGVKYEVRFNNAGPWTTVNSNDYGKQLSAAAGSTVSIRASATGSNQLVNYTGPWSYTFPSAGDCLDEVTPAAAQFYDSVCEEQTTGSTQAYYVVPATANVTYQVKIGDGGWTDVNAFDSAINANPGDIVTIKATAAAGYKLVGDSQWVHEFENPGDCLDELVIGDPIFEEAVCTVDGPGVTSGTYFIPITDNVSYEVKVGDAAPVPAEEGIWQEVAPGVTVVITAKAAEGYVLVGDDEWTHTFATPSDCLDEVPTQAVTSVDQECELIPDTQRAGRLASVLRTDTASYTSGYLLIPNTPNVKYYLWPDMATALPAGPYDVVPGVYFVHAVADPGYKLTGQSVWELEVLESHACDQLEEHPTVTPVVTFVQTTCSVAGSYTLGVEEPGLEDGVIWTVTPNSLSNTLGKHNVTTPGKVTITATPAEGYGFPEVEGAEVPVLEWEYTFTGLPEDCLPTLALTGGNAGLATGAVGFAALLMLGGAILVARNSREQFTAE